MEKGRERRISVHAFCELGPEIISTERLASWAVVATPRVVQTASLGLLYGMTCLH